MKTIHEAIKRNTVLLQNNYKPLIMFLFSKQNEPVKLNTVFVSSPEHLGYDVMNKALKQTPPRTECSRDIKRKRKIERDYHRLTKLSAGDDKVLVSHERVSSKTVENLKYLQCKILDALITF